MQVYVPWIQIDGAFTDADERLLEAAVAFDSAGGFEQAAVRGAFKNALDRVASHRAWRVHRHLGLVNPTMRSLKVLRDWQWDRPVQLAYKKKANQENNN